MTPPAGDSDGAGACGDEIEGGEKRCDCGVIKKVFESQPAVSVHDRGGGGGGEGQLSRAGKEVGRGGGPG